jgi:hypothetical protein
VGRRRTAPARGSSNAERFCRLPSRRRYGHRHGDSGAARYVLPPLVSACLAPLGANDYQAAGHMLLLWLSPFRRCRLLSGLVMSRPVPRPCLRAMAALRLSQSRAKVRSRPGTSSVAEWITPANPVSIRSRPGRPRSCQAPDVHLTRAVQALVGAPSVSRSPTRRTRQGCPSLAHSSTKSSGDAELNSNISK